MYVEDSTKLIIRSFFLVQIQSYAFPSRRLARTEEETAVEDAPAVTELLSLESFGRLRTPPTGEVELSVDCKQNLLHPASGAILASQKIDMDVSLCAAKSLFMYSKTFLLGLMMKHSGNTLHKTKDNP